MAALLDYAGISSGDFSEKAYRAVDDFCINSCGDQLSDQICQQDYQKILAELGKEDYKPTVFLSESGKLCLVSDVVTPVGIYKTTLELN